MAHGNGPSKVCTNENTNYRYNFPSSYPCKILTQLVKTVLIWLVWVCGKESCCWFALFKSDLCVEMGSRKCTSQVTSKGYSTGRRARWLCKTFKVSPSPNPIQNRVLSSLRENCLSQLFINRAVTCTCDLRPVFCNCYVETWSVIAKIWCTVILLLVRASKTVLCKGQKGDH